MTKGSLDELDKVRLSDGKGSSVGSCGGDLMIEVCTAGSFRDPRSGEYGASRGASCIGGRAIVPAIGRLPFMAAVDAVRRYYM